MERNPALDRLASGYAKLVLALGCHDGDYVDAFYGPAEWKLEAGTERASLAVIQDRAVRLQEDLEAVPTAALDEAHRMRRAFLLKQVRALLARTAMLAGQAFSFDEESALLYDAVASVHPAESFTQAIGTLGDLLPGTGPIAGRYHAYMGRFVIPGDRLGAVFAAAMAESRARTRRWIPLPGTEDCAIEYVTGKPWSGYNWYKGAAYSLIQVNTDLPIHIDRAIDLASHEGYPGHHVYNALLEVQLVQRRGWLEFTTYPLYSPQSLIAEGTANFGIEMAFPAEERAAFERDVLFPLAGLDASELTRYDALRHAAKALAYASNEAARQYLDGHLTRPETARWLQEHALLTPERAEQRVRFIEASRSYVINYNLGQDLVRHHIESQGGTPDRPERRWELFTELLTLPWTPSALAS
jgi:hypothetical protein